MKKIGKEMMLLN